MCGPSNTWPHLTTIAICGGDQRGAFERSRSPAEDGGVKDSGMPSVWSKINSIIILDGQTFKFESILEGVTFPLLCFSGLLMELCVRICLVWMVDIEGMAIKMLLVLSLFLRLCFAHPLLPPPYQRPETTPRMYASHVSTCESVEGPYSRG